MRYKELLLQGESKTGREGSTSLTRKNQMVEYSFDREDARHLIATCLAESGIDIKATRLPKAEVLGEIFSLAVNTDLPIDAVLDMNFPYFRELDFAGHVTPETVCGPKTGE